MQQPKEPLFMERILSAATYMTAGAVGFIWLVISFLTKKSVNKFFMYHIMQSIFISIAFYLISSICKLLYVLIYKIPVLNAIPYLLSMPIPLFFNMSIVQAFTTALLLYLSVTSFLGYYSYLPWVSNVIKSNRL